MQKYLETKKETYQLIGFINIVRDILSLTFYLNNMKEYLCIKDFYIEDKKFASKGDHITLLPDDLTAVNTNGNQKAAYLPTIKGDRDHFMPTFEVKNNNAANVAVKVKEDKVNHPSHYTWLKEKCGIEVIDITRWLDFNTGNAVKYLLRAGHKSEEGMTNKDKTIQDLKKAVWYIQDRIKVLQNGN